MRKEKDGNRSQPILVLGDTGGEEIVKRKRTAEMTPAPSACLYSEERYGERKKKKVAIGTKKKEKAGRNRSWDHCKGVAWKEKIEVQSPRAFLNRRAIELADGDVGSR